MRLLPLSFDRILRDGRLSSRSAMTRSMPGRSLKCFSPRQTPKR